MKLSLTEREMRRAQVLLVFVVMAAMRLQCSAEFSAEERTKCQMEVKNLMSCLSYVQKGSTTAPTDKCCTDLSGIRSRDAACLCYLLSATLSSDESFKSLNLDSTRMLQLPTACKLQNTSVSQCPKLLGLAPNSPGAAIFSGVTDQHPNGNTTKTSGASTSTSPTSGSYMLQPSFDGRVIYAIFVAVIFCVFPSWP